MVLLYYYLEKRPPPPRLSPPSLLPPGAPSPRSMAMVMRLLAMVTAVLLPEISMILSLSGSGLRSRDLCPPLEPTSMMLMLAPLSVLTNEKRVLTELTNQRPVLSPDLVDLGTPLPDHGPDHIIGHVHLVPAEKQRLTTFYTMRFIKERAQQTMTKLNCNLLNIHKHSLYS